MNSILALLTFISAASAQAAELPLQCVLLNEGETSAPLTASHEEGFEASARERFQVREVSGLLGFILVETLGRDIVSASSLNNLSISSEEGVEFAVPSTQTLFSSGPIDRAVGEERSLHVQWKGADRQAFCRINMVAFILSPSRGTRGLGAWVGAE